MGDANKAGIFVHRCSGLSREVVSCHDGLSRGALLYIPDWHQLIPTAMPD